MIASVVFKEFVRGSAGAISPLWNPEREARDTKDKNTFGDFTGHFPCIDGFGDVSKEEKAAGLALPRRGARQRVRARFELRERRGGLFFFGGFSLVQEHVTRTMRLRDGEQVLQVDTEIQSALGSPAIFWAEHTIAIDN